MLFPTLLAAASLASLAQAGPIALDKRQQNGSSTFGAGADLPNHRTIPDGSGGYKQVDPSYNGSSYTVPIVHSVPEGVDPKTWKGYTTENEPYINAAKIIGMFRDLDVDNLGCPLTVRVQATPRSMVPTRPWPGTVSRPADCSSRTPSTSLPPTLTSRASPSRSCRKRLSSLVRAWSRLLLLSLTETLATTTGPLPLPARRVPALRVGGYRPHGGRPHAHAAHGEPGGRTRGEPRRSKLLPIGLY